MQALQNQFEEDVNKILSNFDVNIKYANINIFDIWNNIKGDEEFRRFAKSCYSRKILCNAYTYVEFISEPIDPIKNCYYNIIDNYTKKQRIAKFNLERYEHYVSYMLIVIHEYLDYYSGKEDNLRKQYTKQIANELNMKNTKVEMVLNMPIGRVE